MHLICQENIFFRFSVLDTSGILHTTVCNFDTPDGTNIRRTESENVKLDKERFCGALAKETGPRG